MKIIIGLISLFLLTECPNQHPENITGNWQWKNNDTIKDFSLNLKQNKNTLEGSYCGIFNSGKRIDCPNNDEKNIKGTFKNGKWEIDYVSNYSSNKGKAVIIFDKEKNSIIWKDHTTNNGSLCPEEAILIK